MWYIIGDRRRGVVCGVWWVWWLGVGGWHVVVAGVRVVWCVMCSVWWEVGVVCGIMWACGVRRVVRCIVSRVTGRTLSQQSAQGCHQTVKRAYLANQPSC